MVPKNQKDDLQKWFFLGCVFSAVAIIAFFWAFAIGNLTPSQHFLLMWLLPLTSGFACGCFSGSLNVSGTMGKIFVAATGGFAVWFLSYFLLPGDLSDGSRVEMQRKVEIGHQKIRNALDAQEKVAKNPEEFNEIRTDIEEDLSIIQDSMKKKQDILSRDTTKGLIQKLESDKAKRNIEPGVLGLIKNECSAKSSFGDFESKPVPYPPQK